MIDERTINQILDRAEIADVVGDFLTLHRKGRDFVALCPFHDDRSPSLHISTSKNICKCFACGEGGTPVSFVMKHEHFTFVEAVRYLGKKYGIEIVERELSPQELERKSRREQLLSANAFARDEFVSAMHQSAEGRRVALSYFRERGLLDETIKEFELGYSPSTWDYLVQRAETAGISVEVLEELGLIMKTKRGDYIDRYRERVIFPIHSSSGNVVGFGGRILKPVENVGKYINSPSSELYDKSNELYGLYFAKRYISKEDKCIVLEGYMDVLSMYQKGVRNVVASSGTALTSTQVLHIRRLTPNVTLLFDADGAGIKAALRGLDICLAKDMKVNVLVLPDGEDPDSFAQSHTLEDIKEYVRENEEDGLSFKCRMLTAEHGATPQGKATVIEELAQSIGYIEDQISRELYIGALSQRMEVSNEALTDRVEQIRRERQEEERRAKQRNVVTQQVTREEKVVHEELQNLSTKAPRGLVKSKVSEQKIESPFAPYELTLMYDLIDFGIIFLPDFEMRETQKKIGANVIEAVYDSTFDLRRTGGLSDNFQLMLDKLMEAQEKDPKLEVGKYLTRLENETIFRYADDYLTNKEELSPIHEKFVGEMMEYTEVEKVIMKDVLALKNHKIEELVKGVLEEISRTEVTEVERINELLGQLEFYNNTKRTITGMLGDRPFSSKNTLLN